jgi:carbamoyltransferase
MESVQVQRSTNVLGVSAFFHDSSAALLVNGKLVAAAAEERFTRLKHDSNFPSFAIEFCLQEAGISVEDLDSVVFYEEPHLKFSRVLVSLLAGFPASRQSFGAAMKRWLTGLLWTRNRISAELEIDPRKVQLVPHHHSHAAQAFAGSPFPESAILCIDAVGEWACTSIAHADRSRSVPLRTHDAIPYPHSLGLVYSAFPAFLGFRPNDGEADVMALAAFGTPCFVDRIRTIVRLRDDGLYSIDGSYFDFVSSDMSVLKPAFIELFGAPRNFHEELPFDALGDTDPAEISAGARHYADVAASIQRVLEDALIGLARRAREVTGSRNLCLAGGVALNAVAIQRLIAEAGFDQVFIPPDPGDGGAAIGAAWLEYQRITEDAGQISLQPFLGKSFPEPTQEYIEQLDISEWVPAASSSAAATGKLEYRHYDDPGELARDVAEEILSGRIVGWYQGRAEIGPRALGGRSILADPANLAAVRRLAAEVKRRKAFRPFALSVRAEDTAKVFDFSGPHPLPARWMLTVSPVRAETRLQIRGAMHRDGTTRPQICSEADHPAFHALLSSIADRHRIGALLNTSFNEPGYPIVSSPNEALLMFARTSMDVLAINNVLIRKPAAPRADRHDQGAG